MNKLTVLFIILCLTSCAELQGIADQYPQMGITETEIASGLKQALNKGIETEVSKLTEDGGFFRNELVRITLPPELQRVDQTLRDIGLERLADQGLQVLNRAAEEAVKEATPIFVNAVRDMTITDARNILMGSEDAATTYLRDKTMEELYSKFNPVILSSLDKVGANDIWTNIINRYNAIPLTSKVNPDLSDYVTQEALEGVFTMIAVEEHQIRTNLEARTSNILRRVFALQD